MYIKIINEENKYQISSLMSFNTQHGYAAIRFIGDIIPSTNKGFLLYDDNDNQIADYSDYIFEYRQNEYSIEEDIIEPGQGSDEPLPPSIFDNINKQINAVNNRVTDITPYEETKKGYYGEIEKVFYNVPKGNVSVFFDNYFGEYIINRISNRLIISFPEKLKNITNITIMIQK